MPTKNPPPTREQFYNHLLSRGVPEHRAAKLTTLAELKGMLASAAKPNPAKGLRQPQVHEHRMAGKAETKAAPGTGDAEKKEPTDRLTDVRVVGYISRSYPWHDHGKVTKEATFKVLSR